MYPLSIVLGSALQVRVMEAPTAKLTFSGLGEMTTTGLTVQERKLVGEKILIKYGFLSLFQPRRTRMKKKSLKE